VIEVRLPAMLGGQTVTITSARTIDELAAALRQLNPELAARLDDTLFNFAVNDELLIHAAGAHALRDGDVVEIVPTISGGETAD
jgi:molybdopterin converting factor small subunit